MSEEIKTLADLAKAQARNEEERSKLTYKSYLDNLKLLIDENNPKIISTIFSPESNDKNEYVCIKEPCEFIHLFNECSGMDENIELFEKLLETRDKRVVEQIIKEKPNENRLWFNTTSNGINLRPGLKNEEWASPMPIVLGDDSVHALVVGRTGAGKSVFLNNIIFSLLAEYSPWEINLYLADFKKVEFSRYLAKYDVPHIKSVAATSEIRYVVSLLSYLVKAMRARQDFFSLIGLQKLSQVRKKYSIVLPRVLLLVDEFQQLFIEATSKENAIITELLTAVTKLGRATGYHLLFASQEMTGTMGQSIFSNFNARFALTCESEISSMILGNPAASEIEKGIVIANTAGKKVEENNQYFKVPYISDEYFYQYLAEITDNAKEYGFASVHKFYQEDNIKNISELESILEAISDTRKKYLQAGSSLFDIITLGEAVVFNHKKYDYETFFIERGVRKNVGIFSPNVDDTAYVCKILTTNFMKSPIAEKYRHFIIARNDLFMKKYDLVKDLNLSSDNVYNSEDGLNNIIYCFQKRKKQVNLLNEFKMYPSLKNFAYESLRLQTEWKPGISEEEEEIHLELWKEVSSYFENKSVNDIPEVKNKILEDYNFEMYYFEILDMLYKKEVEKKIAAELFEPIVVWIIGAEMITTLPKGIDAVLTDSTNYNILFIIVASNIDFADFFKLKTSCDYRFVSGNNESFYSKLNIPYTKKSENSLSIDFAIDSSVTQRSFKKFKYNLKEVIVPEIDFDQLLE